MLLMLVQPMGSQAAQNPYQHHQELANKDFPRDTASVDPETHEICAILNKVGQTDRMTPCAIVLVKDMSVHHILEDMIGHLKGLLTMNATV